MKQKLNASFIVPATDRDKLRHLEKSLDEHFTGFELIPIFHSRSFFDAWRIGISRATRTYIILTHQDTEYLNLPNLPKMFQKKVGLVGVAGSKIISRRHPWWFHPMRKIKKQLSGSIYYSIGGRWKIKNTFGPYSRVVVLDGVCLITKKTILQKVGIPDVTWASWDFYDHILSMEYLKMGYHLITAPITMIHRNIMNRKRSAFSETQNKFVQKYFHENTNIEVV